MPKQSSDAIFGYPAARIHTLMQRWGWGLGGVELVRDVLEISESAAEELLSAMIREGYVQKCDERLASPGCEYELTAKGTDLAQVSTAEPLPRETVRLRLHELIERMQKVNRDERFFVGVQEAFVFGEYLTKAERLGSLDVHYTTYRKIEEREEFARVVSRAARESGRRFSGEIDRLLWPDDEVRDFLQDGCALFRFLTNVERLRDERTPRLAIFRDRAPVHGWRQI